jgi:hypothetical protein
MIESQHVDGDFFYCIINEPKPRSVTMATPSAYTYGYNDFPCVADKKVLDPKLYPCAKGFVEENYRKTMLCIQSSDRNQTLYGDPTASSNTLTRITRTYTNDNQFTAYFPTLYNVRHVKLVSAEIPQTEYIISTANSNNTVAFTDTQGSHTATIPNGSYTGASLASALGTAMTLASGGAALYSVSFDEDTALLTITLSGIAGEFTLLTSNGASFWYNGGFDNFVTGVNSTSSSQILTGTGIVRLSGENFIYLCIAGLGRMKSTDGVANIFAKLMFAGDAGSIIFNTFVSEDVIYPAPGLTKLGSLDISMFKRNSVLYNFQRVPWSITLEITHQS